MPGLLPTIRSPIVMSLADLLSEKRDWGFSNLLANDKPWIDGFKGENVLYVVGDTGASRHRDGLKPIFAENFTSDNDTWDNNGHGSHVAGTVIAQENGSGYVGIAPAVTYGVVKLLAKNGSNTTDNIVRGYYWLAEQWKNTYSKKYRFCVANFSIGGPRDQATQKGIAALWAAGIVPICAMGNSGGGENDETGDAPGVYGIGVTAYDQNQQRPSFSSVSAEAIQAGPGVKTTSFSHVGDGFVESSGTSMASPYISGTWCLIGGSHPKDFKQFKSRAGCIEFVSGLSFDLGKAGRDKFYGFGKPDLSKMVPDPLFQGGI